MLLLILPFFFFSFLISFIKCYLLLKKKKMLTRKAICLKAKLIKCHKNSIHHRRGDFFFFLIFELQILQSIAPQNLSKWCVHCCGVDLILDAVYLVSFWKKKVNFILQKSLKRILMRHTSIILLFLFTTLFFLMAKTIPRKWS